MFIQYTKCKICNNKGIHLLKLKFSNKKILDFFNSEYGSSTSFFLKKKIGNKNFVLLKCKKCDFVWQKFVPNKIFYKNIYDKIINPYTSLYKSKKITINQKKIYKKEIIFYQNFFSNKKMNVLDFGAGWGTWLLAIKSICPNIFAIELSSHRKKYLKKKKIQILDEKKFNNYENFFDIIRLEQVLEHIDHLEETLFLIKKFLKKKGIVIIGVPDGKHEIKNNIFKIEKGPIQPLEHLNCFNNNSLKLLFNKYGFKSISIVKIILLFLKNNKFDYFNLKFIAIMIKNSLFSTKIGFVKK